MKSLEPFNFCQKKGIDFIIFQTTYRAYFYTQNICMFSVSLAKIMLTVWTFGLEVCQRLYFFVFSRCQNKFKAQIGKFY